LLHALRHFTKQFVNLQIELNQRHAAECNSK
jgi:hypothetical protein